MGILQVDHERVVVAPPSPSHPVGLIDEIRPLLLQALWRDDPITAAYVEGV